MNEYVSDEDDRYICCGKMEKVKVRCKKTIRIINILIMNWAVFNYSSLFGVMVICGFSLFLFCVLGFFYWGVVIVTLIEGSSAASRVALLWSLLA